MAGTNDDVPQTTETTHKLCCCSKYRSLEAVPREQAGSTVPLLPQGTVALRANREAAQIVVPSAGPRRSGTQQFDPSFFLSLIVIPNVRLEGWGCVT